MRKWIMFNDLLVEDSEFVDQILIKMIDSAKCRILSSYLNAKHIIELYTHLKNIIQRAIETKSCLYCEHYTATEYCPKEIRQQCLTPDPTEKKNFKPIIQP
jgi:hypothetical protein